MFTEHATPGHSVGLSVGATQLAGIRDGHAALTRRCEVTLRGQRFTGFVDRVGDPVPLVASDGTPHRAEALLAEALGHLAHSLTGGVLATDMAIAVPAHWRASVVDVVRDTMRDDVPVVSDATAALTALRANPGLPTRGVIVLMDFGGSGTSITLVNASSDYAVVGETVRYTDFSGAHLDQALLTHVVAGFDTSSADPAGTAMVGSLVALREECRRAKERLSAQSATTVSVDLPSHHAEFRITRAELEELMQAPLAGVLTALDDTLEHYGVPPAAVAAVATIGGGARVPLITQRLSEHLRTAVVTTPHPHLTAAEGASLIAARNRVVDTKTTVTPAPGLAAPTAVLDESQPSTAVGALAWSQDAAEDELPYVEPALAAPAVQFRRDESLPGHPHDQEETSPRRAPLVLFLVSVAAVLTAAMFGVVHLTSGTTPVEAATSVAPSPAPAAPLPSPTPPAPQAPDTTTVVVQPAQRANPQSRPARVPAHAPVGTVTQTPTTQPPPTQTPEQPGPAEPPAEPPAPEPPPVDPGPGDGGTPPIDPGPGDGGGTDDGTPPIDPGPGDGGTTPSDPGPGDGGGTDGEAASTGEGAGTGSS